MADASACQLRQKFKQFATLSVFLSLKNEGKPLEFSKIANAFGSSGAGLKQRDLATFCGVLGKERLVVFWEPEDGTPQLHYTLCVDELAPAAKRAPKRQRTSKKHSQSPATLVTRLVEDFDTALTRILAEQGLDAVAELANSSLPPMPRPLGTAGDEPLAISELLNQIESMDFFHGQIVASAGVVVPAADAQYGKLGKSVDSHILAALRSIRSVSQLYSHQSEAIDAALRGEDVVVSTATASGKSAIYQVPILQALVDNPQSKALLIFPTKALAQDQLGSFQQLAQGIPGLENVVIEAFDGDTRGGKAGERQRIRESASVILTNPDTLHTAMLQNKKMWAHVFNNLRYVVIDELHVYYGQFGQHVSCIMARLARVCEKATFQFICCSATTSNPRELAQQITHRKEFTVVDTDGSPRAGMHMVLWDSAAVKKQSKQTSDLVRIAAALLQNGTRTIVFCKFRQVCELVAREIVDYLEASPDLRVLKRFVASYRAGYTLEQRRQIEQDMFSGITRMIVATSALELGIDVGVLDAVLMVGVPANKVNLWQQAGRAGRRGRASLAMVIATGSLVDRQVVKRPSDLFVREFQSMHITSEKSTALGHLQCAAFEQAIDMTSQIDRDLVHNMQLDADDLDSSLVWDVVTQQWIAAMGFKPWPAEKVPIRSIQQSEWQVVETHGSSGPTLLEELDGIHALFTLYEGGILLHRARTYEIDKVDAESRVALVHSADVSWFTTARDYVDVIPGSICKSSVHGGLSYGDVEVRATVFGYKRIDQRTKRVLELVERRSPVLTAQSLGVWATVQPSAAREVAKASLDVEASVHGAQHSLLVALARTVGCSAQDLRTECKSPLAARAKTPRLIVYEKVPFPAGPTSRAVERYREIVELAHQRLADCRCGEGCTSCVYLSSGCSEHNQCVDKAGALLILASLLDEGAK